MTATVDPTGLDADDLIIDHTGLARALARRFRGRGEPLDDLQGVAQLALVRAARRFDPERNVAFATFATVSILGELKRHFRDRVWWVRAPRRLHDLHLQIGEAREALLHQLGHAPRIADVAAHLQCSEEEVLQAMEAGGGYRAGSIDAPMGVEGQTLMETLGDDDPQLAAGLDRVQLARAVQVLSDQERYIIRCYFFDGRTQGEIAEELSISQMQVSRLLGRSLARVRQHLS